MSDVLLNGVLTRDSFDLKGFDNDLAKAEAEANREQTSILLNVYYAEQDLVLDLLMRVKSLVQKPKVTIVGIATGSIFQDFFLNIEDRGMTENALIQLEEIYMAFQGEAREMRAMADRMDEYTNETAIFLSKFGGGDARTWKKRIENEEYLTAKQAYDLGISKRTVEKNKNIPDLGLTSQLLKTNISKNDRRMIKEQLKKQVINQLNKNQTKKKRRGKLEVVQRSKNERTATKKEREEILAKIGGRKMEFSTEIKLNRIKNTQAMIQKKNYKGDYHEQVEISTERAKVLLKGKISNDDYKQTLISAGVSGTTLVAGQDDGDFLIGQNHILETLRLQANPLISLVDYRNDVNLTEVVRLNFGKNYDDVNAIDLVQDGAILKEIELKGETVPVTRSKIKVGYEISETLAGATDLELIEEADKGLINSLGIRERQLLFDPAPAKKELEHMSFFKNTDIPTVSDADLFTSIQKGIEKIPSILRNNLTVVISLANYNKIKANFIKGGIMATKEQIFEGVTNVLILDEVKENVIIGDFSYLLINEVGSVDVDKELKTGINVSVLTTYLDIRVKLASAFAICSATVKP